MTHSFFVFLAFAASVHAHAGLWGPGMYCKGGNTGQDDQNSNAIVQPLYQLPFNKWWMHAVNDCDKFPPPDGEFLELPAGSSFAAEIATNRGATTLAFNGKYAGDWPGGVAAPVFPANGDCISQPLIHTHNENEAAGTALAIAYVSELSQVTPQNLAVFTVRLHTPWKRVVNYDVPKNMPACPPGGCICAWGWVPNHCGQPNMYMQAFKCKVTGATSTTPVAAPQPPVWCEGNPSACTKGSKQMIYFNQLEGNNIDVNTGYQADGQQRSPGYNSKLGWSDGAQNDIFAGAVSPPSTTTTSTTSTTTTTTSRTTTSTQSTTSTTSTTATTTSTTTTSSVTTSSVNNLPVLPHQSTVTTTTSTTSTTQTSPTTSPKYQPTTSSKPRPPHTTSLKPRPPHTTSKHHHHSSHTTSKHHHHSSHTTSKHHHSSHTTSKHHSSHTTSSKRPSHSGGPGHCNNKSRREATKRHLAANRKRAAVLPHHGGIN